MGDLSQVSPTKLFVAGVLPVSSSLRCWQCTHYIRLPERTDIDIVIPEIEGSYWGNLFAEIRKSFLSIMLPVIILGGIYGILGPLKFTVTEAAAVAVVYALVVELFIHRELKWSKLPEVLSKSGVMMASILIIAIIAFNSSGGTIHLQNAAAWICTRGCKWQFSLVNIFLLGWDVYGHHLGHLDCSAFIGTHRIVIWNPPTAFGIMFIVNLELGYLTPPLGINLSVSSSFLNDLSSML